MLRLSRTQIALSTGIDLGRDPRFTEAVARGVSYSPAYFSGSRPLMSISMAHSGFNAGVTLAEIDLNFLSDRNAIAVQENAVVVDEAPGADRDVVAVIASDIRLRYSPFSEMAEQLPQQFQAHAVLVGC